MVKNRLSETTEYILSGPNYDRDKKRSAETTQQLPKEFEDGTVPLQKKLDRMPYQVPHRCMAYKHQKPFKEELGRI